jgi:NAD(P)H-hydrate epimerase
MKILSSEQIRKADAHTIKHEPISSVDLVERASMSFVRRLLLLRPNDTEYIVFTGPGNNGGDGLVIARLLSEKGKKALVINVEFTENYSSDFLVNQDRLKECEVHIVDVSKVEDLPLVGEKTVIIDAIFGSGLSRPVEGFPASVINHINSLNNVVVSVDIPSGLFHDHNSENPFTAVIEAELTISFQVPKLCFLLPEMAKYVGSWEIVDIGLNKSFIHELNTPYNTLELADIPKIDRDKFAHKGTFGHALLCAGSLGKMGATILSSRACLRSGVGLLSTIVPNCGYTIIQESVPEAMAIPMGENVLAGTPKVSEKQNAIGIGPGIDTSEDTIAFIESLFKGSNCPLVIDADALNIISQRRELLQLVQGRAILTPHPKEFDRLTGESSSTFERIEKQVALSKEHNIVIVLKGHHTSISLPDGSVYFNTTGNPGMSTAGSGDVLTGVILAFLAMGNTLADAAKAGVYLHGLSGNLAAKEVGEVSMIASDLIEYLPQAFQII